MIYTNLTGSSKGGILIMGYKYIRMIAFLVLIFLLAPDLSHSCTSFAFSHKGYLIFGTNYDNSFAPGLIYVNKRNVEKSGWEPGTDGKIAAWVSKYGSVTFSCVGYQLAWAGMNEAGLVISTMSLSETKSPGPDERPPLISPLWIQYILDTCGTIEEVIESNGHMRISDTRDHYFVCDRKGNCAVIEFLDGKMVYHTKAALPVKALANSTYSTCLSYWKQNASLPSNSYDSRHRFVRVARMMESYKGKKDEQAIDYAFGMLKDVRPSNEKSTRWSIVFDTKIFRVYYRSYDNSAVRSIDFKKFDFDCQPPVKMLRVHNNFSGDITHAFRDYSHDLSLDLLLKAVKNFRPDYPLEQVEPLLGMFEGFRCKSKQLE